MSKDNLITQEVKKVYETSELMKEDLKRRGWPELIISKLIEDNQNLERIQECLRRVSVDDILVRHPEIKTVYDEAQVKPKIEIDPATMTARIGFREIDIECEVDVVELPFFINGEENVSLTKGMNIVRQEFGSLMLSEKEKEKFKNIKKRTTSRPVAEKNAAKENFTKISRMERTRTQRIRK